MKRTRFALFLAALGLGLATAAAAQEAYTTRQANVRAGPERDYPLVARLAAGTPVDVVGCVEGYDWCDVVAYDIRGWVSSRSLQYVYNGRRVGILDYGPTIGLPLIGFSLGYWDSYYRNRPFYRERPRWERHWNDGPRFVPRYDGPRDDHNRPRYDNDRRRYDNTRPNYDNRPNRQDLPQIQQQQPPQVRPPLQQAQPPQVQRPRPEAPRPQPQVRPGPGPDGISRRPPEREPGGN